MRQGSQKQGDERGGRVASGGKPVPKPKPPPAPQRWFQERTSPYAWEQDGLDHVKQLMPQAEPYRAWATFSFTAASGRVNECDLFIAVPGGLYLVELKGHQGRVVNNGDTWSVYPHGGSRRGRTLRNPLHLTDLKCKELKQRLEWAAQQLYPASRTPRIPRIEPAIFLSAPGLRSELDEVQRTRVYGRDEECDDLDWIWRDLLARPPRREHQRITPDFSRNVLTRLMEKIGIRASTAHLRFGDDWTLSSELLDAGPTWEDRFAERSGFVLERGRVRIYLTEQQADADKRRSVERAARREYQVLQGITHRGIAQAMQIRQHQGGPAILFRHEASDLRLDSYMDLHGATLSTRTRLDMVRQLAEAVQYAHHRSLYHRALSARSVYVSAHDDGSEPVLRIIDWQAAARDFDTTAVSVGNTSLTGEHLASSSEVYFAPEFAPHADPVDLDVFGLGALSFLILTGQPPATQRSGLIERLAENRGLRPYAVSDGISDALDALVFDATRTDLADRLPSAEAFLQRLDQAEWVSVPESATPVVDPLTVSVGQVIDGDWRVERVLGTGATARALLVSRPDEDADGTERVQRRVLKVALDEDKAEHLRAEARALDIAGGGVVVRKFAGPRVLGGRTVLDLEYAGGHRKPDDLRDSTLGEFLRAEGKLTYHNLDRYGRDLFTALDQLAAKGVRHRDLKPDNFGIYRRADRSTQLMLFDFSLAEASERDVKAGTRGYLDPFLDTNRRPVYDDHAERYAAAVTLHEMASGRRPVWGDGVSDPRLTSDATPAVAADLFEPALRDGLTAFFQRALHRDVDRRFDTLRQMEDAWRAVFTAADEARPITTPGTVGLEEGTLDETRDAHAEAATLDTQLDAAGLTPRAVSVAQSFGAATVRELVERVRPHEIAKARGAGLVTRKELIRRHKQWTQTLLEVEQQARPAVESGSPHTVADMAAELTPTRGRRGSRKADVVRLTLGLPEGDELPVPWPTQGEVAARLGITQGPVSQHYRAAVKAWAELPWLAVVRDELVELLTGAGRVMTAHELAAALRARHGAGADDTAERMSARALAVVRAAVDTEVWDGQQPGNAEVGPRLAVVRRGEHLLIALESLPGTDDPSAPELADYAVALGARADELVGMEPLPGRGVVVRELRAVPAPEGLPSQADTRLVELAAVLSRHAAASPRLELYPRELDLVRALRISQAAAGVRREPGITQADLLAKVRARFPALAVDDKITHVQVEEALHAAGFPLEFDTATRRFRARPPERSRPVTSSSTALSGHGRTRAAGLDPREVLAGKLTRAVEYGGFVALTVRGVHLPAAPELLAEKYPLCSAHVDGEFLAVFRELVREKGQDWERVRKLDARFGETGEIKRGFRKYVADSWTLVGERLLERAGSGRTVLFLHHADLVARYWEMGGHEFLTGLQQAARRPAEAPHGLWLLCPAESARDAPHLGRQVVEVLTDAERVVLDGGFLDGLRGEAGSAA